ncbi:MAG: dockerin type I domain-containing protein [Clostridiales bacterium]|jgi:X-Pro dipeptidyl-peptidase|nr:dockerin type I domain-containing protein [Clostridiales bacterium]
MRIKKFLLPGSAALLLVLIVCFVAMSSITLAGAAPAPVPDVGNEKFQNLVKAFPGLWDEEKGVTQPVFNILAANVIHEEVWVEVPVESFATGQLGIDHSSKGQRDLVCIRITRPRPVDPSYPHTADPANPTGVTQVPVLMVHSPYRGNNLPTADYNRAIAKNHPNTEFFNSPVMLHGILQSARAYEVNPDTTHYTYADDVKSDRLKMHEWPWTDAAYPDTYYSIPASRGAKPIAMAGAFSSGAVASGGLSLETYSFARGFAIVQTSTPGNRYGLSTNSATSGPFNDGLNAYGEVYEMLAGLAAIKWLNGECRAYKTKAATEEVVAYWANGDVAMTGTSYVGTTQMALASAGYEPLRAILPRAGLSSMYTYFRQNGAVYPGLSAQGEDAEWLSRYDLSRWQDPNFALGQPDRIAYENIMARHANEISRETGDYNKFWDMGNWYGQAERYKAAVLFMQGFEDRNVGTQHMDQLYKALKEVDPDYPIKLILHLGAHTTVYNWAAGQVLETSHKWLDRFIYGIENGIDTDETVAWVANNVTGECNEYSSWPAPGTEMRRYYFGQTGDGGGQLFTNPPAKAVEGPFADPLSYRGRDDLRDPDDPFYNLTAANYSDVNSTNWWYTPETAIENAWEATLLFPTARPSGVDLDEILKHTNARLAYVTEPLTKPVTLSSTARVTLDVTPYSGIGSVSAMIVDLGVARRSASIGTNAAYQIPAFANAYTAYNRGNYSIGTATTQYKVVTRNSVDIQNPNPSGITYLDPDLTRSTGFVPPYWYQTTKIVPGESYSYTFTLEPRHYTFAEGHRLAVVIYSTDYRHTIRPEVATKFELNLGEDSYIDLPLMSPLPNTADPVLKVANVSAAPGGTVDVTYSIENNTLGFTALDLKIPYDSTVYAPVAVTPAAILATPFFAVNPVFAPDTMRLAFVSDDNIMGNGLLFTVSYKLAATAPLFGDFPLNVDIMKLQYESTDDRLINLGVKADPGTLVIGILGDVNGDGIISPEDAMLILQMIVGLVPWTPRALLLGDINGDGVVDTTDAALILRMVVGG